MLIFINQSMLISSRGTMKGLYQLMLCLLMPVDGSAPQSFVCESPLLRASLDFSLFLLEKPNYTHFF